MPNRTNVHETTATPNDPQFPDQWHYDNTGQTGGTIDADIDLPEAWERSPVLRKTVIAIMDSGVDYTHPDLVNNMWVNPGEIAGDGIDNDGNGYIDDIHGIDPFEGDSVPHGRRWSRNARCRNNRCGRRQRHRCHRRQLERQDHGASSRRRRLFRSRR